jgi:uncharacterized membrane protein SpoIIM required for sporulation
MFALKPTDLMRGIGKWEYELVAFEIFVFILLAAVVFISLYIASVATVEPPLEWYQQRSDTSGERGEDYPGN